MDNYINNFFFTYLPHIALAIFFFGLVTRLILINKSVQAESTQFLADKKVKLGSNLFHIGIIFVFFGHLTLFIPEWLYHLVMTTETKRIIALSMGSFFGIMAIVGMLILVSRRFSDPRIKANSSIQDYLIIFLLLVEALIGLTAVAETATGPIEKYAALSEWAQAVVTFQPDAGAIIAGHSIQYKLHIVTGLFIFMIFPYTKLMHILVYPFVYIFRSGYQLVRKRN
ncbi:MAG: respiratory nitrate reductase subunit gamma [Dysgonamonadaceae bacterium]|nr:respiratory nitrate reductase subunit gamma [Dysgonamonadaceae bacterium]MDD4728614.1 respiratory nitrate reductase subunit gamma [Dysgonamonadaceae bacterium]